MSVFQKPKPSSTEPRNLVTGTYLGDKRKLSHITQKRAGKKIKAKKKATGIKTTELKRKAQTMCY
jgi:hypothetical protein